ncbi:SDR family oxidoreductase [Catalinimonas niigatensis]|uniref:SDR family oxidoreductase n=1 Tax=Catalinimonas niigatensis TaxID=1397264 RepID=UPI0026651642|nr:NAD(P)H-binding protein [Catalinimonas niigatensis]WPP50141.1 NAD(P)H-binding protein [Catalinimonas niigatensis]
MIQKVLFVGATGMLGRPVALELHKAGYQLRALVRNVEKARKLLPQDIELVEGNLQNDKSIQKAIQGMDAVYLSLSVSQEEKKKDFHAEKDGLRKVIVAARQENIRRIALLSSLVQEYTTDWWVFEIKRDAIRQLKESRIPFSIFYPSNFMESIPGQFMAGNRLLIIGKPRHKLWWIAAHDYGKQVARALQIDEGNHHYIVQGPEALSQEEALEQFAQNLPDKDFKITKLPIGLLKFLGIFSTKAAYGANILESINNYPETFRAEETWQRLGKPETTFRQFAQQLSLD